jgi:hypothetical protein
MNKTNNTQTRKDANEQEHKNKERRQQKKEQDQKPTQKHNAQNLQNTIYKLFFIITNFGGKNLFII